MKKVILKHNIITMTKGINLLELLFAVFLVLSLAGVQPFNEWGWYVIALPLVLNLIIRFWKRLWYAYGLDKILYTEIEKIRYENVLKRETNRFKKELKK